MIRTESLTKFYGTRCAVRDLTVTIEDREIVGFLGLNGAGKTTTLRMLAGLLAPSSGHVEIDGEPLDAAESGGLRWRIGFLPERPPLYEEMAVAGFLGFAARLRGLVGADVDRRVDEVLAQTSLRDHRDEPIQNLSHGYRQRVGIAQAIVHDPALVILDEPITGLDPVQIREMRTLIRDLKDRHTVLLSSHNLPEIHQTCDRLMVIEDGALVHSGTEQELARSSQARLRFEVRADEAAVRTALGALVGSGVLSDLEITASDAGRTCGSAFGGEDAEEAVARSIVEAGLGLRGLRRDADQLETLFVELTRGEA